MEGFSIKVEMSVCLFGNFVGLFVYHSHISPPPFGRGFVVQSSSIQSNPKLRRNKSFSWQRHREQITFTFLGHLVSVWEGGEGSFTKPPRTPHGNRRVNRPCRVKKLYMMGFPFNSPKLKFELAPWSYVSTAKTFFSWKYIFFLEAHFIFIFVANFNEISLK